VFHPGQSHKPSSFCVFHCKNSSEGVRRGRKQSGGLFSRQTGERSMLTHLHRQATTTPKIRADIQASDKPAGVWAERFGTTERTAWKWRKRDSVQDRSHAAHRLQTTLTPAQEAVAVALRKTQLVSLDDLLAVVREFLNPESRAQALTAACVDEPFSRHCSERQWRMRGQSARAESKGGSPQAQRLQGIRTRICPHRREVSASNG